MNEWNLLRRLVDPANDSATLIDRDDIDWEQLIELASAQRMLGVLANRVSTLDSAPPDSVQQTLQTRRKQSVQTSLGLTNTLHSVLDHLSEASIRALPFKGPVLSELAHGDVGVRQYVDADVLVDPAAFDRARDALLSAGYQPVERLPALGEVALRSDDGWTVDLHQSVFPRYFPMVLEFDDLWFRRERNDIAGRPVPTLAPADRILVLSVHGTKHCWYRLAWIHDLATLLADDHADWRTVRQRADQLRCRRHVALGMELTRRSFDQEIPSSFQDTITEESVVSDLADRVETRRKRSPTTPEPPKDIEQFAFEWRAFERRTDRLRFAVNIATIPSATDVESIALPSRLRPLYRLVRPVRLAARWTRMAIRQVRR